MGSVKNILEGSIVFRILVSLNHIYAHSFLRRCLDTFGAAYDNSRVMKALFGKNDVEYYSHSYVFKLLKLKIRLFDYLFKKMSAFYRRLVASSQLVAAFQDSETALVEKPLKMAGVVLFAFGLGYLVFRHTIIDLLAVLVILLVAALLFLSPVSLNNLLKTSCLYRVLKYLLD